MGQEKLQEFLDLIHSSGTFSISDAINAGNLSMVKWLIEHGYWSPRRTSISIDQVAESGDIEMIKYLDTHAELIFTQRALETKNLAVLNFFKEKIENKIHKLI